MLSERNLKWAFVIFGAIGLLDSVYLSWVKIAHTEVYCGGSTACDTVNTSKYAEIAGVPIAFLGLGAYIVLLALSYLETRQGLFGEYALLGMFVMTLGGTLYSFYLTYLEIYVIRAICPYCVVSAIVISLMFVIALIRLLRGNRETA
jgi:uncharacterized membrane protein